MEDDPNVRDLVDRIQKYHDVVEKEFTGQKVMSRRGVPTRICLGVMASTRMSRLIEAGWDYSASIAAEAIPKQEYFDSPACGGSLVHLHILS